MPKKKYRIWVERRIEHCIEVTGDETMTPAQARDVAYESQQRGAQCSKHSTFEKANCNSFIEISDTELYEDRKWKVL